MVITCAAYVVLVLGLLAFTRYPLPAVPQIAGMYGAGLMTGYAHQVHEVRAAGFVMLSKPVEFATLLDKLTLALKKSSAVPLGKIA